MPILTVGPRPRGSDVDSVHTAVGKGVRQAIDHLVGLGHRSIVHVDAGAGTGATQRRTAYRAALRRYGLEANAKIIRGDYTERSGAEVAQLLLREPRLPDAILAANDSCALGVLGVLVRAGVDVPGDVSIVGYDDGPLSALPYVDLTTVRQDTERMAQLAIETAMTRLEKPDAPRQDVVLDPALVVRGTTGPPRNPRT